MNRGRGRIVHPGSHPVWAKSVQRERAQHHVDGPDRHNIIPVSVVFRVAVVVLHPSFLWALGISTFQIPCGASSSSSYPPALLVRLCPARFPSLPSSPNISRR